MEKKKGLKILSSQNGIALIAVLAILLILTLFLPLMYSMSELSLEDSVVGVNSQKANYLARTVTEMSVASFKKVYNQYSDNLPSYETADDLCKEVFCLIHADGYCSTEILKEQGLLTADKPNSKSFYGYNEEVKSVDNIKVSTVYMYKNKTDETYKYAVTETEKNSCDSNADYEFLGTGNCEISFDDNEYYYKIYTKDMTDTNDEGKSVEYKKGAIRQLNDIKDENGKTTYSAKAQYKDLYDEITEELNGKNPEDLGYSVTKVENEVVVFKSTAEVKNQKREKRCVIVLPTYASKKAWLLFDGTVKKNDDTNRISTIEKGCNQVQPDPTRSTGRAMINYSDSGIEDAFGKNYKPQALQIYSCLGNLIVDDTNVYDSPKDKNGNIITGTQKRAYNGRNGAEFVFGLNPSLNTTPNDDPSFNIIDGINAASYASGAQKDNFIAYTATNAIDVQMPINLMVNGVRSNRLGDGFERNRSIYKVLMFQAPVISFSRNIDMMISLHDNDDARRLSCVTLMAPSSTPYSYFNSSRQETVKAGIVYFAEDCYLWVIPYGNTGSGYSEHWYEVNQTVYFRDKDFAKVKIANAGDLCYFNAEVTTGGSLSTWEKLTGKTSEVTQASGLPLAAWALETKYIKNYNSYNTETWWQFWSKTKNALFGAYLKSGLNDRTYETDDLHLIGNVYEDSSLTLPDFSGLYTVWDS